MVDDFTKNVTNAALFGVGLGLGVAIFAGVKRLIVGPVQITQRVRQLTRPELDFLASGDEM